MIERLFRPQWAGGWELARVLWVVTAVVAHMHRFTKIEDAYASEDAVFITELFFLAEYVHLTPAMGQALWGGTMLGILAVSVGGRLTKPGILCFLMCAWTLMGYEALNVKAHDRLFLWISVGLLFAPVGEQQLTEKARSPVARWWILLVYMSVYGSAGLNKLFLESSWLMNGDVLAYAMVHPYHGDLPIGVWMSGQPWLCHLGALFTLAFECAFPFLILHRRSNPAILVVGLVFHVLLLCCLWVGPFTLVSLCMYPVLLHPDHAKRAWDWLVPRFPSGVIETNDSA